MIKNIIFDMGNVLINYAPLSFLKREGINDPLDVEILMREVFRSEEWSLADEGKIKVKDIDERCCKRLPERLRPVAHKLILTWYEPLEPIPGMADFIRRHKEEGMGMYVLTNAPDTVPDYFHDIPGSEYIDGLVISSEVKMSKPSAAIFNYLLDKYGLRAQECLFIDDLRENVTGAEAVGIKGYVFDGEVDKLEKYLAEHR